TEDKLGTGAVTNTKLGAAAVTEDKLGTGAVTNTKLGAAAVTADKMYAGAYLGTVIASGTLGSSAASIDVSSIASGYKKIELLIYRMLTSTGTKIRIALNNDSSGDYYTQYLGASNSTVTAGRNTGGTYFETQYSTTGGYTTDVDFLRFAVYNHAASDVKICELDDSTQTTLGSRDVNSLSWQKGFWNNATEVNRITVTPATGTFGTGTMYVLVGYK
ncbi:MAG: hypothetical protein WCX64_04845, partial [Candidatus Micrarchaeia archaeon]